MKRIKVLQLQPNHNVQPIDVSDLAEQIVKAFPNSQYEFVNAVLIKRPKDKINKSIAERTVYFDMHENALRGLRLQMTWALFKFLRKEKFDVIICHRFKPTAMVMRLCRWIGAPLCISVIHSFSDYKPLMRRRLIRQHAAGTRWHFVAVSDALKRYLVNLKTGFTEQNTLAITNAIDVEKICDLQLERAAARAALGLPKAGRIVGTIGRLVTVKGHIYLIKAFAKIQHQFPDAHLAIIGGGREEKVLLEEISRLDLKEKIHLLGERGGAVKYIKAFDIWAMPSLSEGLGLALLEGMSGKLPCIASDVPAMKPLIEGAGGLCCKPAEVNELAQALETYLSLSDLELENKGLNAYDYLIKNHSIETFRSSYLSLVKNLHDN